MEIQCRVPISDRYADRIIDDPFRFDAIEVHEMRMETDANGLVSFENESCTGVADGYSVFVHLVERVVDSTEDFAGRVEGGVDCCGDFTRIEEALGYALELSDRYGWPIYDDTGLIHPVRVGGPKSNAGCPPPLLKEPQARIGAAFPVLLLRDKD